MGKPWETVVAISDSEDRRSLAKILGQLGIDAMCVGTFSQCRELLAPAGEPRGSALRIDELFGARLEHQHRGRNLELAGALFDRSDHVLMAEVHAIVITHGEYAAPGSVGNVLQTAH